MYYPKHDRRVARIKECCVDSAIGLVGQLQCAWQPEVHSKVDVLGAQPAVQVEHRLNLARQIGKMAMRIDCRFLAASDPLD